MFHPSVIQFPDATPAALNVPGALLSCTQHARNLLSFPAATPVRPKASPHTLKTHIRFSCCLQCRPSIRYVRHPGYLGWYVWCIGTQLLLVNPLSCISFAYVVSSYR